MGKNENLMENINKLKNCLKNLEEGKLILEKDMFCKEEDFELATERLKKYIISEINHQKSKIKSNLFEDFKESD